MALFKSAVSEFAAAIPSFAAAAEAPAEFTDSFQEGDTSALYRSAIGPRGQDYYLTQFAKFDAAGRTSPSWHWGAYWSTLNWLIYRRMWRHALAYVAVLLGGTLVIFGLGKLAFGYSSTSGLLLFLGFLAASYIVPGLYANSWFYDDCQVRISKALRETDTLQDACRVLEQASDNPRRLWTLASVNLALLATLGGSATFYMLSPTDLGNAAQNRSLDPISTMAQAQGKIQGMVQGFVQEPSESTRLDPDLHAAANPSPSFTAAAPIEQFLIQQGLPSDFAQPAEPINAPVMLTQATKAEPKAVPKSGTEQPTPAPPPGGKVWFVQVGAFAQESNAQNVRLKLEGAGLSAQAEASQTKVGPLIRVRVGPFKTKAEAENASLQVKALDLPSVLFKE
jgi:cell division septation protein DedD